MRGRKRNGAVRKQETSGRGGTSKEARSREGLECGQAFPVSAPPGAVGTLLHWLSWLEPHVAVAGNLATSILFIHQ